MLTIRYAFCWLRSRYQPLSFVFPNGLRTHRKQFMRNIFIWFCSLIFFNFLCGMVLSCVARTPAIEQNFFSLTLLPQFLFFVLFFFFFVLVWSWFYDMLLVSFNIYHIRTSMVCGRYDAVDTQIAWRGQREWAYGIFMRFLHVSCLVARHHH